MKKKTILTALLAGIMVFGAVAVDAAKPARKASAKRPAAAATTPAKVTTQLPDGFGLTSLIGYRSDWECYSYREDAAKNLLNAGFTVLKKGKSKELTGTFPETYQTVSTVTYGFEGIKVTLIRNEQVEKIVFPNKETLNQFIATALQSGAYEQSDWSPTRYNNIRDGLGSFYTKGLTVNFDWAP